MQQHAMQSWQIMTGYIILTWKDVYKCFEWKEISELQLECAAVHENNILLVYAWECVPKCIHKEL